MVSDLHQEVSSDDLNGESFTRAELGRVVLNIPLSLEYVNKVVEAFSHRDSLKIANGDQFVLDENGSTILLFSNKGELGLSQVFSPYTSIELLRELSVIPSDMQKPLLQAFKLPEPSSSMKDEAQTRLAQIQSDNARIDLLKRLPLGHRSPSELSLSQDEIRGIISGEFAMSSVRSKFPGVATFGLESCLGMSIYDRNNQIGALAHIDTLTDIEKSIGRILHELGPDSVPEVTLIGGDTSSRETILKILEFLDRSGIPVMQASILEPRPSAFVLDCRTGDIYGDVTAINTGESLDIRVTLATLVTGMRPLRFEFDGR